MTRRMGLFSTWRGRTLWKASEFVSLDYLGTFATAYFLLRPPGCHSCSRTFRAETRLRKPDKARLWESRAVNN